MYCGKVELFVQSGCIPENVDVLGQKWLYYVKFLYSRKMVVFGFKMDVLRQKW